MIPRLSPSFTAADSIVAVAGLFRDHRKKFESAFAEKFQCRHALAYPYARSAVYALLKALDLEGEEIVLPAYTCVVVPHAIVLTKNRPRFVDCQPNDFNVGPEQLRQRLSSGTKMVIPTPIFGYPVDQEGYARAIAERSPGAFVLYDCAYSYGIEDGGGLQYRNADAVLFSLGIGKQISTCFGGMLLMNDTVLYEKLLSYREKHFRCAGPWGALRTLAYGLGVKAAFSRMGARVSNYLESGTPILNRFTEYYYGKSDITLPQDFLTDYSPWQAEVGLRELQRYDAIISRRREIASLYDNYFTEKGIETIGAPFPPTYSHYPLLVPDRPWFMEELLGYGVQVGKLIDYVCPLMPFYEKYCDEKYENAEQFSKKLINLPLWFRMTDKEAMTAARAVSNVYSRLPSGSRQ